MKGQGVRRASRKTTCERRSPSADKATRENNRLARRGGTVQAQMGKQVGTLGEPHLSGLPLQMARCLTEYRPNNNGASNECLYDRPRADRHREAVAGDR